MGWNAEQRKAVKARAKDAVWSNIGRVIGIYVLYTLPVALVVIIWMLWVMRPWMSVDWMSMSDTALQAYLPILIGKLTNMLLVVYLLFFFVCGPLQFGMEKFFLLMNRGEEPHVSVLFKPFSSLRTYWAGVKMYACLMFRAWLWMLIPTIIYCVIIFAGLVREVFSSSRYYYEGISSGFIITFMIAIVFLLVAAWLIHVKVLTYHAGYWLIDEDDCRSVWACTREGARVFKGHYGDVLKFSLSFIGWFVLQSGLMVFCNQLMSVSKENTTAVVLCVVAMVCISLSISPFLSAYYTVSFYGMYEVIRSLPESRVYDIYGVPQQDYFAAQMASSQRPAPPSEPQEEDPHLEQPQDEPEEK